MQAEEQPAQAAPIEKKVEEQIPEAVVQPAVSNVQQTG